MKGGTVEEKYKREISPWNNTIKDILAERHIG